MAAGRLGSHTSSGAVTQVLYEVPSGKSAEVNVNVYNNSGGVAKVTLFRAPTGTPSATHTIQVDSVPLGESYQRTALVLFAGENLCYKTDVAGVSVVVSGVDYTSNANVVKQQDLITTNTETVIYTNGGAKDTSCNVTVSLGDGAAVSDTVTCTLYVSTTNAAGGFPICKNILIGSGVTGIEYSGLYVSSTDKIILVTTGIVGQVATTVSGYLR
jgi:hypothetical protein